MKFKLFALWIFICAAELSPAWSSCRVLVQRVVQDRISALKLGEKVRVVDDKGHSVAATFVGATVGETINAVLVVFEGSSVLQTLIQADLADSTGRVFEPASGQVDTLPQIRMQKGETCMANAAFNCVAVLRSRGLLESHPLVDRFAREPTQVFGEMKNSAYPGWFSYLSLIMQIYIREKLWGGPISTGQELQNSRVAQFFKAEAIGATVVREYDDFLRHLGSGLPAILSLPVDNGDNALEVDHLVRLERFRPQLLKFSMPDQGGALHAVVVLGYLRDHDQFVVIDSNYAVVGLWPGARVRKAFSLSLSSIDSGHGYMDARATALLLRP